MSNAFETAVNQGPSSGSVMSLLAELTKSLSPVFRRASTQQIVDLKGKLPAIQNYVEMLLFENAVTVQHGDEKLEELCALPITALELSQRSMNTFMNEDIHTVGQVARLTRNDTIVRWGRFRNFGEKSYAETLMKLRALGLHFGLIFPVKEKEKNTLKEAILNQMIRCFVDYKLANDLVKNNISTARHFMNAEETLVMGLLSAYYQCTDEKSVGIRKEIITKIENELRSVNST